MELISNMSLPSSGPSPAKTATTENPESEDHFHKFWARLTLSSEDEIPYRLPLSSSTTFVSGFAPSAPPSNRCRYWIVYGPEGVGVSFHTVPNEFLVLRSGEFPPRHVVPYTLPSGPTAKLPSGYFPESRLEEEGKLYKTL